MIDFFHEIWFSKIGRSQTRRRINLIGRLQLSHDNQGEDHDLTAAVVELRHLRAQEAIIKILKIRKRLDFNELYQELVDMLRFQFVPSKRLIKEVVEWLIDKHYIRRDSKDMNIFIYISWNCVLNGIESVYLSILLANFLISFFFKITQSCVYKNNFYCLGKYFGMRLFNLFFNLYFI